MKKVEALVKGVFKVGETAINMLKNAGKNESNSYSDYVTREEFEILKEMVIKNSVTKDKKSKSKVKK